MRDEVFKCQEGVTDMGFRPVDEDAAFGTNEDIARIEIAVAKCVRNAHCLQATQGVLYCCPQLEELIAGHNRWGHFLLLLHQVPNDVEERVNHFEERAGAQISAACL